MASTRYPLEPSGHNRLACPPIRPHRLGFVASMVALTLACVPSDTTRAREQGLQSSLQTMRQCIHHFRQDKGRFPTDLQELVSARYLRKVPVDPVTGTAATWRVILAPDPPTAQALPQVIDVRSGAPGLSSAGTAYASW